MASSVDPDDDWNDLPASPARKADTVELLELLSRQLNMGQNGHDLKNGEDYHEEEEEEEQLSQNAYDHGEQDQNEQDKAFGEHIHAAAANEQQAMKTVHVKPQDVNLMYQLEELRAEFNREQNELRGRVTQLEDENRFMKMSLRKSKERIKEQEDEFNIRLDQERAASEKEVYELQMSFEEERKQFRRERYELDLRLRDEMNNLADSYEIWANDFESQQNDRLRLAEDARIEASQKAQDLQIKLQNVEAEKQQLADEFEKRLLEYELELKSLAMEYEEKMRHEREAWNLKSRKRVSKALDAMHL